MVQITRQRSALRAAAYREAGHAAAAFDHGQRIRAVSILRPSDTLGATYLRNLAILDLSPPISPAAKDLLERRILTVLAGPAAECWFRGPSVDAPESDGEKQLVEVVSKLHQSGAVASAYIDYLRAQASAWLALPAVQRTINTIATALVARRRLTGEEARRLWQQAKMPSECRRPEPIPFPA